LHALADGEDARVLLNGVTYNISITTETQNKKKLMAMQM